MFKCEFCNKELKSLSSMNYHKNNAKYCLSLQNKQIEDKVFMCEFCDKELKSNKALKYHSKICDKKIDRLNEENNDLKLLLTKSETESQIYKKDHETITEIVKKNENPKSFKLFKPLILNDITIIIREDGYINLTQLCKAGGKEFKHWKENKNCEAFLHALSSSVGIPTDDLIKYETGSNENRATWGHRLVAIEISRWISHEFGVKIIRWTDEILITGKVELDNEKSNKELENLYQEKITKLQNRLNNYETTIFNRNVDYCPIEYYGKDIVYFIKFNIPTHLHSEYIAKYPNIDNEEYNCIEFGVTSDIEERLKSHKRDKKKENLIFLHAIEIKNRYTSSKMEFYIKRIARQLSINFEYEKRKECILVNEENFNILVNKINAGLINIEDNNDEETDDNIYQYEEIKEETIELCKYRYDINKEIKFKNFEVDKEIKFKNFEVDKEIKIKNLKIESVTDLLKNNIITFAEYTSIIEKL